MKKKKGKVTKKKKKFFIIAGCYLAVFLITSIVTLSTLAWFNSSTHASNVLYMGGPVYIHFGDDEQKKTSGSEQLVVNMPPSWTKLYPGMNIEFEARAIIEGASWEKEVPVDKTVTIVTTGAILRARVMMTITDPSGSVIYPNSSDGSADDPNIVNVARDIYNWIWPQLKEKAINDDSEVGKWVFDGDQHTFPEDNYYYYVMKGQTVDSAGKHVLQEVGGVATNVSVGFLNKAVVTLPGVPLTNDHSDCRIKFTVVFHALQAFLPYTEDEIGETYLNDDSGREVDRDDVGMPKPLTIENSRDYFAEAFTPIYPDKPEVV